MRSDEEQKELDEKTKEFFNDLDFLILDVFKSSKKDKKHDRDIIKIYQETFHPHKKLEVANLYIEARNKIHKNKISDITDLNNNQYVDIVMEGGGVLGVALLGYLYALEVVGIRFKSIGGTSAGAITALFLAVVDTPDKPKVPKLLKIIGDMPMDTFLDYHHSSLKKAFEYFTPKELQKKDCIQKPEKENICNKVKKVFQKLKNNTIVNIFYLYKISNVLTEYKGLCRGDKFEQWVKEKLDKINCCNYYDIQEKMNKFPPEIKKIINEAKLKIVTAEISTETRIIFPEDIELFEASDTMNPAKFVRASMSIPFIFTPFELETKCTNQNIEKWKTLINLPYYYIDQKCLPEKCTFIDGGIVSNFPINLFHENDHKKIVCPTFGVKLELDNIFTPIEGIKNVAMQSFHTARRIMDRTFIQEHSDYKHLVTHIDTGNHDWLNFNMKVEDKLDLFLRGMKDGFKFVSKFNWEDYKKLRQKMECAEGKRNSTYTPYGHSKS